MPEVNENFARVSFDPSRLIKADRLLFHSFRVTSLSPLSELGDDLSSDEEVVLVEDGRNAVALLVDQLAFHHVIQGGDSGNEWAVTFCVVCNTGNVWSPRIDGKILHFMVAGAYNGMVMLEDEETGSYWDHITGECVHGPMLGRTLEPLGPLRYETVGSVLEGFPDAKIARSKLGVGARIIGWVVQTFFTRMSPPHFRFTLPVEKDNRLPRRALGLAVWAGEHCRFYPMDALSRGGGITDELAERGLFVYVRPSNGYPEAIWVDTTDCRVEGGEVRVGQAVVRGRELVFPSGDRVGIELPQQSFTRWYGYSVTFPGGDLYSV